MVTISTFYIHRIKLFPNKLILNYSWVCNPHHIIRFLIFWTVEHVMWRQILSLVLNFFFRMFTKQSLQATSFIKSRPASEDKSPPSKFIFKYLLLSNTVLAAVKWIIMNNSGYIKKYFQLLCTFPIPLRRDPQFFFKDFPKITGTFKPTHLCDIKHLPFWILNQVLSRMAHADARKTPDNGLSGGLLKEGAHIVFWKIQKRGNRI